MLRMDLNLDMSSLAISIKKRRQSGLLGCVPPPGNESPTRDHHLDTSFDLDSYLETKLSQISNTTSSGSSQPVPRDNLDTKFDLDSYLETKLSQIASTTSSSGSQSPTLSPEMGKTDPNVEVRRSSRRKSVINIQTSSTMPTLEMPLALEFDVEKDIKQLRKIYLDKRVRKTAPSLETIFEAPTDEKVMSSRKFRRFISFQDMQKNKVRKRPLKAKEAVANYNKLKRKSKVSMDALMQKLNSLESD